jgi:hypothetical protein
MADRTPDLEAERAAAKLRGNPDFAPMRASFLAMIRRDLPPGIIDLSLIEADPDTAFFLLMKLTTDATRDGKPDPAPWFTAWAAECLQGPVVSVRLPTDKNKLN